MCCDALKGLPEAIRATWPLAEVQLCVVHLVRSSLRYTSKKRWGQVCRELPNAIESLNARFRRAVRHRGHFPNEQAALKVLYVEATERRKNRSNSTGRVQGWKQILNALTIHYGDRITAAA